MTRILCVSEHKAEPGLGGGGAESMLRDLTTALTARGHAVAWLQSTQIEQAVEQFKPDICHVQTIHNFIGMGLATWLQEHRVPMVWALMDYWPWCRGRMLCSWLMKSRRLLPILSNMSNPINMMPVSFMR